MSTYHTWKNKRQHYKKKLKIIAPIWNDEFELPDGSHSLFDIQNYIEYIIITHEALPTNLPIHIDINRNYNKIVFKIKDGYKLELETLETMKLFVSTKK